MGIIFTFNISVSQICVKTLYGALIFILSCWSIVICLLWCLKELKEGFRICLQDFVDNNTQICMAKRSSLALKGLFITGSCPSLVDDTGSQIVAFLSKLRHSFHALSLLISWVGCSNFERFSLRQDISW